MSTKIFTLDEVQAWLVAMTPPVIQQVKDELMLIEAAERRKHKHFAKENINKTLSTLPPSLSAELVGKVYAIADSRNITLKPGDCTSDKFLTLFMEQVSIAMVSLRQKLNLPEEMMFDKQGRCGHDQECDRNIADSLEYITHLIIKYENSKDNNA